MPNADIISFRRFAAEANAVVLAMKKLSRLRLSQILEGEVYATECPDISNPGGYYHLGVVFSYPSLLGFRRKLVLYFEQTAFDESTQEAVLKHVKSFIASCKMQSVK